MEEKAEEKKKWYKKSMAIIGMVAAVIGIVTGVIQIKQSIVSKKEKIQENTEIVLDRSLVMNEPFDGSTKWSAAVDAVQKSLDLLVADSDNLALRIFGGNCSGEKTELVVKFGQYNKSKVSNALRSINIVGKTTLVSAVLGATGDFNVKNRFGGVNKKIILIAGSGKDPCCPDAIQFINDRLQGWIETGEKIKVYFKIIGLGIPADQRVQLAEIAKATGGKVLFAETREELKSAIMSKETVDTTPPAAPTGLRAENREERKSAITSEETVDTAPPAAPTGLRAENREERKSAIMSEEAVDTTPPAAPTGLRAETREELKSAIKSEEAVDTTPPAAPTGLRVQ